MTSSRATVRAALRSMARAQVRLGMRPEINLGCESREVCDAVAAALDRHGRTACVHVHAGRADAYVIEKFHGTITVDGKRVGVDGQVFPSRAASVEELRLAMSPAARPHAADAFSTVEVAA